MTGPPLAAQDVKDLVVTVVHNEQVASEHREPFLYESFERSDRTGGHLWTEKVAETSQGKLRYLTLEDSQPLTAAREEQEKARLAAIVRDPSAWAAEEAKRVSDERRLEQLISLLPKAFIFERAEDANGLVTVKFHPDPAYQPATYEERVMHGLSGTMTIDDAQKRMTALHTSLQNDVTFGFGLLATVRAGSSFDMERTRLDTGDWKTTSLKVKIDGRIMLMKSLARNQDFAHKDFHRIPADISVAQAVAEVER